MKWRETMASRHRYHELPLEKKALIKARFLARPNRFLVVCEDASGNRTKAFLPNPGRLTELLLPDVALYLIHQPEDAHNRATQYTVLAVEHAGRPIMLHTHWCNYVARILLDAKAVPGLEAAHIVRPEITVGRSRFDFLMRDDYGEIFVEVKSCTLFGNGVAMFPDAVTERGRRHLLELAEISRTGKARCRVLFVVQTPTVRCFMPDYHTDPAFAQAMLDTRDVVTYLPLPVSWDHALRFRSERQTLPIPWEHIEAESGNRGAYLVILRIPEARAVAVGALGQRHFPAGYYVYIGSAMKGLDARMARHRRKRKRMHWHIDYLCAEAELVDILPVRASTRLECDMARALTPLAHSIVEGFGCADCPCASHLYYWPDSPLHSPLFHTFLQQWRMRVPNTF